MQRAAVCSAIFPLPPPRRVGCAAPRPWLSHAAGRGQSTEGHRAAAEVLRHANNPRRAHRRTAEEPGHRSRGLWHRAPSFPAADLGVVRQWESETTGILLVSGPPEELRHCNSEHILDPLSSPFSHFFQVAEKIPFSYMLRPMDVARTWRRLVASAAPNSAASTGSTAAAMRVWRR